MIMIDKKWEDHKKILNIFKNSKIDVLKGFCVAVKSFIFTKKNNSKDVLKYTNENGKRIDKNQMPIECVEILTFSRNTTKANEIVISHFNKGGNINIEVDKSLSFKEEDGKVVGKLSEGNRTFSFEIKDDKVSKFGEIASKNKEKSTKPKEK